MYLYYKDFHYVTSRRKNCLCEKIGTGRYIPLFIKVCPWLLCTVTAKHNWTVNCLLDSLNGNFVSEGAISILGISTSLPANSPLSIVILHSQYPKSNYATLQRSTQANALQGHTSSDSFTVPSTIGGEEKMQQVRVSLIL